MMAAAASGIWNHATPANSLASPHPAAAATGSSTTTSNNGAGISANDFLALLVTEMKNQDPTANTDPNEYVNQLVQVNSLEQLININQTLSTDLGSSGATGGLQRDPVTNPATTSPGATPSVALPASLASVTHADGTAASQAIKVTAGNLSVPAANPAAQRVAHSLSHRTRFD
jgi:flagellar basal-body rod modification protein FlgD